MSKYIPTFLSPADRWLRNGVAIPGARLKSEFDLVRDAHNDNEAKLDGSSNHQFIVGCGYRWPMQQAAVNPVAVPSESLAGTITGAPTDQHETTLTQSDTAFTIVPLPRECFAYGCKQMYLSISVLGTVVGGTTITSRAAGSAASHFLVRDASVASGVDAGDHIFEPASDAAITIAAVWYHGAVTLRNINNSIAYRNGTTCFAVGRPMIVRIIDARF